MDKIFIRKASLDDINYIIKLNKTLFDLEYNNFDDTLDTNRPMSNEGIDYYKEAIINDITLVAVDDNIIVGYLIWTLNTELSYNTIKQAELNNMCILEEYRKCGVGTRLFNEFKNVCMENNIEEIKVTASYGNTNAIKFYRKVWFKESELTLKQKIDAK